MSGRFFSLMVYLSVGNLIFISPHINWKIAHSIVLTILFLIIFSFSFTLRFPVLASQYQTARMPADFSGAIDERFFYYSRYGLLSDDRKGWPDIFKVSNEVPTDYFFRCGGVGAFAVGNPNIYTLDRCALTDPFLSRIPAINFGHWRPGHNFRKLPTNFGEYLLNKIESVKDPSLMELFSDINLVARGDLISYDRFWAIWKLNTNYNYNVNWEKYKDPNLWIPISEYYHKSIVENWEIPLTRVSRNESLEIVSKSEKTSTGFLAKITFDFQFEIYINDKYALELEKGIRCEEGKLIIFDSPVDLTSIKFLAVNMKMPSVQKKTKVDILQVLGPYDEVPRFEPGCKFSGKL